MIIGLKMWPLERKQSKKLTTDDARRTMDDAQLTTDTALSQ